jgi:hypothetical protein
MRSQKAARNPLLLINHVSPLSEVHCASRGVSCDQPLEPQQHRVASLSFCEGAPCRRWRKRAYFDLLTASISACSRRAQRLRALARTRQQR